MVRKKAPSRKKPSPRKVESKPVSGTLVETKQEFPEFDIKSISEMLSFGVVDKSTVTEAIQNGYDRLLELSKDGDVKEYSILLTCFLKAAKLDQDERKRQTPSLKIHARTDLPGISLSSITSRLGIGGLDK